MTILTKEQITKAPAIMLKTRIGYVKVSKKQILENINKLQKTKLATNNYGTLFIG